MPARKETRLRGRTWVNRWQPIDGTSNGVTVSTDETGLITVSGEVADAGQSVSLAPSDFVPITPGAKMSCIQSRSGSDTVFSLNFYNADAGYVSGQNIAVSADGKTFTIPESACYLRCTIWLSPGGTLTTGTFRVMLVDGDEVPDCFTAPGVTSAEPTKLATAGRNLVDYTKATVGATVSTPPEFIEDGFVIDNTGEKTARIVGMPVHVIKGLQYSSSCKSEKVAGDGDGTVHAYFPANGPDGTGYSQYLTSANGTFTVNADAATFDRFSLYVDTTDEAKVNVTDIQLEPGSATDYEAPNVTETALPEGLVLRSLPDGTADELVIRQDGTAYVERRTAYVESFTDEYDGENYWSSGNGLNAGDSVVYEVERTVEELGSVTLPELPETFCEYPVSDVPCRESVVYELG